MGNRAIVTVEGSKVGVYLHWNGGRDSVLAFLKAAKDLGVRAPGEDVAYFYARFVQVIGNFFGGTTIVGIDSMDRLDTDNGDNGVFVIDKAFNILRREHVPYPETDQYDTKRSELIYSEVMAANKEIFSRE